MDTTKTQNESASMTGAESEILAERNVEVRTVLAFKMPEETIGKLLPPGWKATPPDAGPSKGANLNIILADRLLVQKIDGQNAVEQHSNQLAVLAVPGHNPESGAKGVIIVFGLSARAEQAPGFYGVFKPSEANMKRVIWTAAGQTDKISEEWSFTSQEGDRISLQLEYQRKLPARSENVETKAYSAKNPNDYRIYRADQGVSIVYSGADNSNLTTPLKFSLEITKPGIAINGTQNLVSVVSQHWTVRNVFVRAQAQAN